MRVLRLSTNLSNSLCNVNMPIRTPFFATPLSPTSYAENTARRVKKIVLQHQSQQPLTPSHNDPLSVRPLHSLPRPFALLSLALPSALTHGAHIRLKSEPRLLRLLIRQVHSLLISLKTLLGDGDVILSDMGHIRSSRDRCCQPIDHRFSLCLAWDWRRWDSLLELWLRLGKVNGDDFTDEHQLFIVVPL